MIVLKELFQARYAFGAMVLIVTLSNYLLQFPINDWLTWGGLLYPVSFLVTELTNRFFGPQRARHVVYLGFTVAVALSMQLAPFKIAFASGIAFLNAQLLDIFVFNRLRRAPWWYAPFFASFFASLVDSVVFWNLAFWGEAVPLLTWMLGDFSMKVVSDSLLLIPFRWVLSHFLFYKPRHS